MKRLGIGIIFFAGLCIGCVDSKRTDRESLDFFGVDLNKANQIEVLHNELLRGKVKYREKTLTEWTDGLISDYDMSDGKVTSMTISEFFLIDLVLENITNKTIGFFRKKAIIRSTLTSMITTHIESVYLSDYTHLLKTRMKFQVDSFVSVWEKK